MTSNEATQVTCPVCYCDEQVKMSETHLQWSLYRCPRCVVHHFWPAKNPGADYYEVSDMYQGRDTVVDWLAWYHRAGFDNLPVRGGTLLDVGCGNGTLVAAARDRGFDATGIDFSAKAIEMGKHRFGIDQLYCASTGELRARFPGKRFDVITAFEVMEHMDDVGAFLREIDGLLAPGGYLVVSVPNRERVPWLLNEGDVPPHHFTRWNREAVRRALELYGLPVQRIVISPASTAAKNWLLMRVHFNFVMGILHRADGPGKLVVRQRLLGRARRLMILKDRLAGAAAAVIGPMFAPFLTGPMMVTVARKPETPTGV